MPILPPSIIRRPGALAIITGTTAAAVLGTAPALAGEGRAQAARDAQPQQPLSFDTIEFPIAPITGRIGVSAQAGWVWREGTTHRILLQEDVDVTIADHRFLAKGASLWVRKLGQGASSGVARYQVYAVFEHMRSADGTITLSAQQIPVRAVVEVDRPISLGLDASFAAPPSPKADAFDLMTRTNAVYAQRVLGASADRAQAQGPKPWSIEQPTRGDAQDLAEGEPGEPGDAQAPRAPVFEPDGVFSVSIGGRIVIDGAASGAGSVITADGGVTIQYQAPASGRWVDFRCQRVVLYTRGDAPITGVASFGTSQLEGIYLEGGVFAGDDQWSVRAPRMYLDVANNKALMLDTVFWTTDRQTAMPLYLRADAVRQTARDEFTASHARIANTAFFEPDVTLGVRDIRVTLGDTPESAADELDRRPAVRVEAKNVTLKAGPVPVLWLPGFRGDPGDFPLRQITAEDSNRSGLALKTRWNAISLFKIQAPPGVRADLNLDYYAERGLGVGLDSQWSTTEHKGGLFSYLLINDNGTDITAPGRRLERDGENRGVFALGDVWRFTNQWTLVTELSYISDEAFIPALFEDKARETENFRNRLRLERRTDDSHFALELSAVANDFIVPEHLLQSPGYQVSKLPEARFVSFAHDLLPDYDPGLLSYSFEARAGLMRLAFSEVDAASYGFTTDSLADDAFGTLATESLGDKLRAQGLDEGVVSRLDTRHELSARLDMGPLRLVPFIVGRASAYDSDFESYSPGQGDDVRFWGAGGVTVSTTFSKIDNDIESRFFDVHRMRHIVEPSITVWGSDSNFEADDLPIFDDDVEGLIEGASVRAAIDQTWQTKRGGVGRWRDVDLIKLRTEYVWSSEDAGDSPIPQYFSSRPELSNPGEYLGASLILQPTEVLAIAGEIVYDTDADRTAKASIGTILEHRPGFTTTIEYREVEALDATFASLGARYRLSDKYAISTSANYNFRLDDFQTFNAQVLRRFQVGTLGATVRYDNIRGETSIGFVFRPLGSGGELRTDPSWGG